MDLSFPLNIENHEIVEIRVITKITEHRDNTGSMVTNVT